MNLDKIVYSFNIGYNNIEFFNNVFVIYNGTY